MFGAIKPRWFSNIKSIDRNKFEKLEQQDDDEEQTYQPEKPRFRFNLPTVLLTVTLILLVSLILLVVTAAVNQITPKVRYESQQAEFVDLSARPKKPPVAYQDAVGDAAATECGSSVEQAIARGCAFDPIATIWIPPACYDSAYAAETFQGIRNQEGHGVGAPEFGLDDWIWYEDAALSRQLHTTQDLMRFLLQRDREGLGLEAYTQMAFHAAHCSYLARIAVRGLERVKRGESNVWIPEVAADSGHAGHCEHVFGELYRLKTGGEERNWTEVGFGIAPCVRIG